MNIVLIGYRCSGKTTIGNIIADKLGRDLLDTDAWIEANAGCSLETIISRYGWDHFRKLEKGVVEEISRKDNLVIGTGGGVVMDGDNVKHLKKNGWFVWLHADAEVLEQRMEKEQRSGKIRPSLTGGDPLDEIKEVLKARAPLYKQAADLVVDTTTLTPTEAAACIVKAMPQRT
ncbi:MAG: shikimate kinase [Deltaproteobacteria bacterium]|nr:shikimate kinase [Deltaproteobacteria bacterium]